MECADASSSMGPPWRPCARSSEHGELRTEGTVAVVTSQSYLDQQWADTGSVRSMDDSQYGYVGGYRA